MGVKIGLAFSSKVKCNSFMYNIIILVCRTGYFRFHTNPRRLRCLIPLTSELYRHNRPIEVGGRGELVHWMLEKLDIIVSGVASDV